MLNVFRISSGVLPLIMFATYSMTLERILELTLGCKRGGTRCGGGGRVVWAGGKPCRFAAWAALRVLGERLDPFSTKQERIQQLVTCQLAYASEKPLHHEDPTHYCGCELYPGSSGVKPGGGGAWGGGGRAAYCGCITAPAPIALCCAVAATIPALLLCLLHVHALLLLLLEVHAVELRSSCLGLESSRWEAQLAGEHAARRRHRRRHRLLCHLLLMGVVLRHNRLSLLLLMLRRLHETSPAAPPAKLAAPAATAAAASAAPAAATAAATSTSPATSHSLLWPSAALRQPLRLLLPLGFQLAPMGSLLQGAQTGEQVSGQLG
ncbi:hypothetical protein ACK3TF_003173 [Chlorella vulgaris]